MKTYIIPWRLGVSRYTIEQLSRELPNPDYGVFEWESTKLRKARSGDNFYVVWMEDAAPFVVMKGFFLTDPNPEAETIALRPSFIALPTAILPHFKMENLDRIEPELSWTRYCEGEPLPDGVADKLSSLWEDYFSELKDDVFDGRNAERSRKPAAEVDDAVVIAAEELYDNLGPDGEPLILHALRQGMKETEPVRRMAGFLRDVVDYARWNAGNLRERGFLEPVVDLLVRG